MATKAEIPNPVTTSTVERTDGHTDGERGERSTSTMLQFEGSSTSTVAATMPPSVSAGPNERSKSPTLSTMVSPAATTVRIDVLLRITRQLARVRNVSPRCEVK